MSAVTLWLFDVDGVLTHLQHKKVVHEGLFEALAHCINKGDVVALNTGRSLVFLEREIFPYIQKRVSKEALAHRFFMVAEKGALWARIDADGNEQKHRDETISVPKFIHDHVRDLAKERCSLAFFDETKETMTSVEMIDHADLDAFAKEQEFFGKALADLLQTHGLANTYCIDATPIATDIQSRKAGKDLGARRVLSWLKEEGVDTSKAICFGDSPSDRAMAEECMGSGIKTDFVFVGQTPGLEGTEETLRELWRREGK